MTTDQLRLLERALDQLRPLIAGVRDDQLGAPTPCASWDVRTLVEHLVADLDRFTTAATGGQPDWSTPAPAVADPVAAWDTGAAGLLATWHRAGDLTGTIQHPAMGEIPARFPVDQQMTEFAVHAWDLVTATGQPADLDPEVAEAALAWARRVMGPQFRGTEAEGKAFGPEVPISDDAPVYDRLAAFYGRRAD